MTDPSLLRACQDAPWDMVARGIYADWLDDHGEAETAAKFRDPRDGGLLLSLLPEPVWHPPMVMGGGRYELPYRNVVGPFDADFCMVLQLQRCLFRAPGTLPVISESLEALVRPWRYVDMDREPWIEWALTWERDGGRVRMIVGQEPEPQMWYASNIPDSDNWAFIPSGGDFSPTV